MRISDWSSDVCSSDLREAIRAAVAASDALRILVTHGTDTMVVTGRVLAGIAGKTIVMTGAMQPASVRASDAEFNVGFALAAVQTLPPGVYIAMNGMIFDPATTVKDRAGRSEERSVGKEGVSTCRSRWWPYQ